MVFTFYPDGVCSQKMVIDLQDGILVDLQIEKGCSGNLQGICQLVKGAKATEVADKLRGIHCGQKTTSCPDQLSKAIEEALKTMEKGG